MSIIVEQNVSPETEIFWINVPLVESSGEAEPPIPSQQVANDNPQLSD